MVNNRQLTITTANTRKAVLWARAQIHTYELVQRLGTPVRSAETYDSYMKLPKAKQDELKDVGGYVGGAFSGTRRKANEMLSRSFITLDLDNIPPGQADDVIRRVDGLGCFAIIYSTRKHAPWSPRLRVLVILDEDCTADEYEPIARKLAEMIGIEWCDPTTFEASRLMYWPSVSADGEYIFWWCDKPFLSRTGMLALYTDWRDTTSWPVVPGHEDAVRKSAEKAPNPTEKKGVVGAFCRVYSITRALEELIPGTYTPTDAEGRYTYSAASTYGGALVYDDMFLYSHHASDPVCNQLVNAFDLVRLHKFGNLDDDLKPGTPVIRYPSYRAMCDFAAAIPEIKRIALTELTHANDVFGDPTDAPADWKMQLETDKNMKPEATINNAIVILRNDESVKNKIVTDVFAGVGLALGALPWNDRTERRRWLDADDSGLRWFMEHKYFIKHNGKIADALAIVGQENEINRVRDYLESLTWDGVERLDTALIDYLGAEDNVYTRAVLRKTMAAACARAVIGGVKFDTMPILVGPQGIGKSTFLGALGREWFTDSLTTFEGKDAAELIQGKWIVEVGELSALWNREINAIKQFLSKVNDDYRGAYDRRASEHPRRCVFIGTTNSDEFLRDMTGNRRFWPVDLMQQHPTKSVFKDLEGEVDQLWAEAFLRYRLGERLYLNVSENVLAVEAQNKHQVDDGSRGQIEAFLEKAIPANWYNLDLVQQRAYLGGTSSGIAEDDLVRRTRVCAREIYDHVCGGNGRFYDNRELKRIREIMLTMPGWYKKNVPDRFGLWGNQRGYERR